MAATELGILQEVQAYVEKGNSEGKANAELLLHAFHMVENELAVDYFPLTTEETRVSTGKLLFISLAHEAVRVLKVENENGEELPFTMQANGIVLPKGRVKITYTYAPKAKSFKDDGDFYYLVTARLIAYGILAEFTLSTGRYAEWAIWDKKYKNAIESAYHAQPGGWMRTRRWV
jgi:hypothetical protein